MVGNIKIYYYILLMANVIDDKVRDIKSVSKGKNINIIVANPMIWLAEATNNIVQEGENDPNWTI